MPVFALFFPVEIAIGSTAPVHLANNRFKVILRGKHADLKIVLLFGVPGAGAAVLGAMLLIHASSFPSLASYSLFGTAFFKHLSFGLKMIAVGDIFSGFFGGLSGNQGACGLLFLSTPGLTKKRLSAPWLFPILNFTKISSLLIASVR